MKQDLTGVQKRALQYWFVDGLPEIAAGLIGLFLALLFWNWQGLFTGRWSLLAVFLVGFAVAFGLRLIIQRIKGRTTYRQTGYAAPFSGFESKTSTAAVIVFAFVLLAVNYLISTQGSQALAWSPAVAGLVFAFIFAWTGVLTKLRRLYLVAGIGLLTGALMPLLGLEIFRGVGVLSGVVGIILLIQGFLVRRSYLHANLPGGAADE